jgi:hypothetical protein
MDIIQILMTAMVLWFTVTGIIITLIVCFIHCIAIATIQFLMTAMVLWFTVTGKKNEP